MPITMEQFHADYRDKDDYISERIQEADYIAVIIGKTYGENKDKEEISYTEWEYDLACKLGKKIMAFVCDESPDKSRTDVDLERASTRWFPFISEYLLLWVNLWVRRKKYGFLKKAKRKNYPLSIRNAKKR